MSSMLFDEGDRVGGWELTSRIGPCRVCARNMVRGNGSSQLDWTTQARAAKAIAWGLREEGLEVSRHCITARRGREEYVLDALYLSPRVARRLRGPVRQRGQDGGVALQRGARELALRLPRGTGQLRRRQPRQQPV
eukprot:77431-Hanusia_phi.AAC.6